MTNSHANGDVLALIHTQLHEYCPDVPSSLLKIFVDRLLSDETPESLHENMALGLISHLGRLWELIHTWDGQAPKVDIYPHKTLLDGYAYKRTIIHIVHKDSPFLVDSILALIERLGYTNHHFMECDLPTSRTPSGALTDFPHQPPASTRHVEAYLRFEIRGHLSPEALATLHTELSHTLEDIRFAVSDWQPMRHHVEQAIQELGYLEPSDDIPEVGEFLAWINDHHFTFLGYREFPINAGPNFTGDQCLGIFRQDRWLALVDLQKLADHHLVFSCSTDLIRFNQTKVPATVHRPTPMEVIAIKMFDKNGQLTGIRQFIGLSASTSYNRSPRDIPILRLRVRRLLKRSGYNPHGYMGKMLIQALEHFPRDELIQSTEDDLFNIVMNVLRLGPHRKIALFLRQDPYGEFISSLVYVSKDHYSAELKEKFGLLLSHACQGRIQSASSHVSDFAFARLHYILATHVPAQSMDTVALRAALETTSRPWSEDFRTTLLERFGEEIAQPLYVKYKESFPTSYQEVFGGAVALEDVQCIEACIENGLQTRVYQPPHALNTLRIKLYNQEGPVPLADILPILNNLDFNISKDMPYKVTPKEGMEIWIQDLEPLTTPPNLTPLLLQDRFSEALELIWTGKIEDDGFNRLLLRTDLDIWQIQILRAYCKHLKQIGLHLSQTFIEDTLVDYAPIAQNLVRLFEGRFNPHQKMTSTQEKSLRQELENAFDTVTTLDQDQVIRKFYNLISSTLRTNAYQKNEHGSRKDYLSFKVDSQSIDDLPSPRPHCEIFVYSPRMEAIHLRGGPVARGGIRWSDRREDFRTEVLSLLKAQMVKNSVIVPVGSKGGFVVKKLPEDRAEQKAEIIACYKMMMCGLLDLTDNIVQGHNVPPQDVICYDEPDPYLVVAADKGTATFSDIANSLSAHYGFWLDDAFASGGSAGYDHKKMGITARGAWESTRRHFGELNIHPDTDPFTTIAIGDMAGDIFGNGMLLSPCIQLVAAFNHQYIFIDPTPDVRSSFAERQRLFNLPTSTWLDYNPDLISVGGGVWNRNEKSISITPQMQKVLGLPEEIAHLSPSDLIQWILKAPADLLWFGGIGTFVKGAHESHADASDRANDLLRVDAQDMRCKVIVEGANLGMTQNARIEFALKGGLINTDAIDNSGGVDCSDHEVNIKILLSQVMSQTTLTLTDRNALLASMTDDVAALVLRDNYLQNLLLSIKQQTATSQVEDYALLIKCLEDEGALDRLQNNLPTVNTLAERMTHQQGLTRPELAVIIAHTKTWVYGHLITSDFLDDPALGDELLTYFPTKLQGQYPDQILAHPLRREIIGTMIANEVVNRFGTTMICRLSQSSHQRAATIVRTLFSIMDLFGLKQLWREIEAFDHKLPASVFLDLFVQIQNSMEKVALGFLQQNHPSHNLAELRATFAQPLQELYLNLDSILGGDPMHKWDEQMRALTHLKIPADMAKRIVFLKTMADNALDMIATAQATGHTVVDTARVYFYLNDTLGLNWARSMLSQLTPTNTWGLLSRSLLYGDLLKHQTRLVKTILQQSPRMGLTPLETWQNDHQADLDRLFTLIKDIQSAPDFGLPHIDILSRTLGELT